MHVVRVDDEVTRRRMQAAEFQFGARVDPEGGMAQIVG
jgi:hypothetical protein